MTKVLVSAICQLPFPRRVLPSTQAPITILVFPPPFKPVAIQALTFLSRPLVPKQASDQPSRKRHLEAAIDLLTTQSIQSKSRTLINPCQDPEAAASSPSSHVHVEAQLGGPPRRMPHRARESPQRSRRAMQCFRFVTREKEDLQGPARSQSARSNSSMSTDHDARRSGSECCSLNMSSEMSVESFGRYRQLSLPQRPNNLRIFTFQELKSATRNFSRTLMIGEGGFGCVYRGNIRSVLEPRRSLDVAIKQLGRKGLQGHKEWVTEVNFLGVVDHPNLVKLIGYCAEDDERGIQLLLVYEFMPHGSLADHLSTRSPKPASWAMRLRVALDTARGLKYLHEDSEFKIIFRDLKPSNILLDENWKAKLSDFGLARLGPQEGSHVSTAVVGTIGYAAPEYIHTGRLSSKNDIWSYGVVLYELLTGRRPLDRNRPRGEQNLVEWVKPYSSDTKKFETIMDPRLEGNYSLKSAARIASLANKCLVRHARYRPKMSEVLEMVQKIVDSSDLGTPEHPLISHSKELASDEKKRKGLDLKRSFAYIKAGEGRWFTWQKWTPNLVRTQ